MTWVQAAPHRLARDAESGLELVEKAVNRFLILQCAGMR